MYDDNALPCLLTGRDKHWVAFCSALDVEWLSFGTEFMFLWYCIFTFIFLRISKKKNIDTILCAWTWLFKYRVNCEGYPLYMRICGGDRVLSENRGLHVTFSFQMFVWDNRACESRWRGGGSGEKGTGIHCLYLGELLTVVIGFERWLLGFGMREGIRTYLGIEMPLMRE